MSERPPSLELVPFEAARRAVVAHATPLACEDVALGDAAGRTLRRTLVADEDLVPYARSAMDGYAVRAADARMGAELSLAGGAYAGNTTQLAHRALTATPIATGAPLPHGADAVVPFERVVRNGDTIRVERNAGVGDHVFPAGDDARAGDVLASAGSELRPGTLALLAGAGVATVSCTRRARIAVLTTGEELVPVDRTPGFGQIRNSNATLIATTFATLGATVVMNRHVGDDRDHIQEMLGLAAACSDLVVTTGGASVGERDYVKPVLKACGARFAFRSVALRPARPAAFALLGDARILALPGNPAAAFVGLHAFGIPALRALAGLQQPFPPRLRARLRGDLHAKSTRTYLAFVRLTIDDEGRLEATPLDNQCSSLTRTAAGGAGFAIVGPEGVDAKSGALVEVDVFAWEAIRTASGVAP